MITLRMRRYWGTAEIAAHCGVTQQAVSNWLARQQMPRPSFRLRMGPVWIYHEGGNFAAWLHQQRKRRAA